VKSIFLPAAFSLFATTAFAQADVALEVGGKKLGLSGQGQCKAAQQASIHGVNAALYMVSQNVPNKQSLNLSVWQPKDGSPNMMSLSLWDGKKTYSVNTVKGGSATSVQGSGKATVSGTTITLDAVAASGEKITGKIQCRSFGAVQAEGG
jgi:hypothetical protein